MGTDDASTGTAQQPPLVAPAGRAIDAKMALALNVHASPGVYALLLGSGISIASGVQTGWGIVQDLVGRIAAVQDADNPDAGKEAMADPESWWAQHHDEPLGYSGLLAAVAPTSAARQAQLARYFQPEDGDEPGVKGPTAAHHAIAQLVKQGIIRVILTTNFDRLMERALQEVGVSPQVIHGAEQIDAMMPLPHSQVTVLKLHGDYADLEQRNTVDELEAYPEAQQLLLERVLNDYGLIVCGWSGDWDRALVRAVEGTRPRRYPMFWSSYGALGEVAQRLTAQHAAAVIPGLTADELFTDLLRGVETLDKMSAPPVSRDMAVVQLKRALPDPVRRIEVFDLVDQTVTDLIEKTTAARRPLSGPVFADNLVGYRADSDTLLHLLASGVFHDDGTYDAVWQRVVERLARLRDTTDGQQYIDSLDYLRHTPAMLAAWTMGVAAVLARREEFVAAVLTKPKWVPLYNNREPQAPASYLNPAVVMDHAQMQEVVGRPSSTQTWKYPQSRWLRAETSEAFQLVEPNNDAYRNACNRFEFIASLIVMDTEPESRAFPWVGEFITAWGYEDSGLAATIKHEMSPSWPLLQGGAFGGDLQRAQAAYEALTTWKAGRPAW